MKQLIAALLAAIFVCTVAYAAPQAPDRMSGSTTTNLAYVTDSTNATVQLVAAVTGQTVTLYDFILSNSTADNFYLQCGSRQMTAPLYLGATSGLDAKLWPLYIRCNSGEALNLVKGTSTTPIGITFWFAQE